MDKRIIAAVMVGIVAVAAVVVGINHLNNGSDGDLIDSRGRAVDVKNVDTILCHNCCSLELVSYFESVNKVIGIDADDKIAPNKTYTQVHKSKFSALPVVDCSNLEEIIKLNPSVVISSTVSVEDLDNMQNKLGIPVYAINADLEFGDEKWFDQITGLGKLLGEESRAKKIVDGVKSIISEIEDGKLTEEVTGYACGMMFYGAGSFLKVSGDYLPFIYSGITNVNPSNPAGVGKQPYEITLETAASESFDVMFVDGSNADSVMDYVREHRADLEASVEKPAFDNDAIYRTMVYKMWGTQWDNHLINCLYAAKTVNPGAYDWSFEEKADEVFDLLYGEGAFSYSQVALKCCQLSLD